MELARLSTYERSNPGGEIYRTHFYSDPILVGSVVEAVIEATKSFLSSADDAQNLEIALAEIINNIAEHAYGEATDGPIELTVLADDTCLVFILVDQGLAMPGMSIPAAQVHDLDVPLLELPEGGFGWFLIRTLAGNLDYRRIDGQNHLTFSMPRLIH